MEDDTISLVLRMTEALGDLPSEGFQARRLGGRNEIPRLLAVLMELASTTKRKASDLCDLDRRSGMDREEELARSGKTFLGEHDRIVTRRGAKRYTCARLAEPDQAVELRCEI
jgi:hypothetical protein